MNMPGIIAAQAASIPAPITRDFALAQQTGGASNSDTAPVEFLSLSVAAASGDRWAVFWSCDMHINEDANRVRVTLNQDGSPVITGEWSPEAAVEVDVGWATRGGFIVVDGADATILFTLDLARETNSFDGVAESRNGRLVALKLAPADVYVEDLGATSNDTGSYVDACELDFTPDTSGRYLVLASALYTSGLGPEAQVRLYDGTNASDSFGLYRAFAESEAFVLPWVRSGLSGAQTFRLQLKSTNPGSGATIAQCRMLGLRLDQFTRAYATTLAADDGGHETTPTPALELTRPVAAKDFLVLGIWGAGNAAGGSGTENGATRLLDTSGAVINENLENPRPGSAPYPSAMAFSASIQAAAAGRRTWTIDRATANASDLLAVRGGSVIAVLQLE